MKRREFIRLSGAAAAATGLIPGYAYGIAPAMLNAGEQSFILKGFREEQEEYPSLVSNQKGEMWMFSLRRFAYPENRELISAFRFKGEKWMEADPVSEADGQYEAPVAACAPDGNPVVAWCSIESDQWLINVANYEGGAFSEAHQSGPACTCQRKKLDRLGKL